MKDDIQKILEEAREVFYSPNIQDSFDFLKKFPDFEVLDTYYPELLNRVLQNLYEIPPLYKEPLNLDLVLHYFPDYFIEMLYNYVGDLRNYTKNYYSRLEVNLENYRTKELLSDVIQGKDVFEIYTISDTPSDIRFRGERLVLFYHPHTRKFSREYKIPKKKSVISIENLDSYAKVQSLSERSKHNLVLMKYPLDVFYCLYSKLGVKNCKNLYFLFLKYNSSNSILIKNPSETPKDFLNAYKEKGFDAKGNLIVKDLVFNIKTFTISKASP